jgi:hypothetical protein
MCQKIKSLKKRGRVFSASGLAGPVRHPTLHFTVIIIIEHSARAGASATGEILIAGTGTPGYEKILRHLYRILLRQIDCNIVHPGNERAGNR